MSMAESTLADPRVATVLDRLHREAKGDRWRIARALPAVALAWVRGGANAIEPALRPYLGNAYLPLSPAQGRFLYLTARTIGARRVVEFGTSFGISLHYLAAAVKDNGGGIAIGTELEQRKWERACAHLAESGLGAHAEIRLGDALQTLADVAAPLDLVLLDGWKDLYLPMLDLLTPKLRKGAVVLADNIYTFRTTLAPYVERMQSGCHGFQSVTLPFPSGFEYSVYVG
jgi:predicted O-methyltransferase YrrM